MARGKSVQVNDSSPAILPVGRRQGQDGGAGRSEASAQGRWAFDDLQARHREISILTRASGLQFGSHEGMNHPLCKSTLGRRKINHGGGVRFEAMIHLDECL